MDKKITIEIRLFAYLRELFPRENYGVKKNYTSSNYIIDDILDEIGIKEKDIMITMVNGLRKEHSYRLKDGDRLGIFPPVGGG